MVNEANTIQAMLWEASGLNGWIVSWIRNPLTRRIILDITASIMRRFPRGID